jgi:hypothetical protein
MYGVDSKTIHSGDLRVPLVHYKGEIDGLIDKLIGLDSLISVGGKGGNQLIYNDDLLEVQKMYLHSIRQAAAPFSGVHAGGVGIICGAGWSADPNLVQRAYLEGATVIAIGSGIHNNKFAQYWTGSCSPVEYPHEVLAKDNLIKFVDKKYSRHRFFDSASMQLRGDEVHKYPGVSLLENDGDTMSKGIHGDIEQNSLYMGLYIAARLGLSDVVLTGVDMGHNPTDSSQWYAGQMKRSSSSIEGKRSSYANIIKDFDTRLHQLLLGKYGMRIYANNQSPFAKVIDMPTEPLIYALNRRSRIRVSVVQHDRPTLSMEERVELVTIAKKAGAHELKATHLTPFMGKLVEQIPEIFDQVKVKQDIAEYDAAMAAKGGCKSCAQNRLGRFTYRLFLTGMTGPYKEKIAGFWKKELSGYTCYSFQAEFIFAPWHADKQAAYDELRKRT